MSQQRDTASGIPGTPLHIEVPINAPMRGVIATERDFLDVIGDVGREVTSQRADPMRWLFAHAQTNGIIRLRLIGVPARDDVAATVAPQIVRAVVGGMVAVESEATQPEYFTEHALELAQAIAERTAETGPVRVVNGTVGTTVTPEGTGAHVRELLRERYTDLGSVEGRLEGVNVHASDRYFNLYDELTGRSVKCYFGRRLDIEVIAGALERRVVASGEVHYRASGEVNSVSVDELMVLPRDEDLPPFSDFRGILAEQ